MKKYDVGRVHWTLPEFNKWLEGKVEEGWQLMGPPQFEQRGLTGERYLIVYTLEKEIVEGPEFRVTVRPKDSGPDGEQMEKVQPKHDGKKRKTK